MLGTRGGFEDLVIGFPLVEYLPAGETSINTDWPRKLSFPLFIQNVMSVLGGGARFNAARSIAPGEVLTIKTLTPAASVNVKDPDETVTNVLARSDNAFVFAKTEKSGIYEVSLPDSGQVDQLVAVNLLDRIESNLAVRDELKLGYEEIKGTVATTPARRDYWVWLVVLALVVISVEWYIYNRRVFV